MMHDPTLRGPAYLEEPIAFELMKLLLQIAWSDHELQPDEKETVLNLADALLPSDARLAEVQRWLDGAAPLPPPDLAVLRAHKVDVLLEAKRVILADGEFGDDEQRTFIQVERLLS